MFFEYKIFKLATAIAALLALGACTRSEAPRIGSPPAPASGPGTVAIRCADAIERASRRYAELAATPRAPAGTHSAAHGPALIEELRRIDLDFTNDILPLSRRGELAADPRDHNEGVACARKARDLSEFIRGSDSIYQLLKNSRAEGPARALLDETLARFEAEGLALGGEDRARYRRLQTELARTEAAFERNVSADSSRISFADDELAGVPERERSRLPRDGDGKLMLRARDPEYTIVMENAELAETRRRLYVAYHSRAARANRALLDAALALRRELAKLDGRASWADELVARETDQEGASEMMRFLREYRDRIAPQLRSDLGDLLEFKKTLDAHATDVKAWDVRYLSRRMWKQGFAADWERARAYLARESVVQAGFKTLAKTLGLAFNELPSGLEGARIFEVSRAEDGAKPLARLYVDLGDRPGKPPRVAIAPMGEAEGYPTYAIEGGLPEMLDPDEATQVFEASARALGRILSGHREGLGLTLAPATDSVRVEAALAVLREKFWHGEGLAETRMPEGLRLRSLEALHFQRGLRLARSLHLALTDLAFHLAAGTVDGSGVYLRLELETLGIDPYSGPGAGIEPEAGWIEIMNGREDAMYFRTLRAASEAERLAREKEPPALGWRQRLSL